MIKSNRGQLSIFMGVSIIIIMGMLAFVINVGLFVKAKINLQNAVDAAAFSGAATQARQLTNIAYLNWEMRNTYKEWMFKYYILGQISLTKGTENLSESRLTNPSAPVNFLLGSFNLSNAGFDKFNIPSICIHNKTVTDICPVYSLPGIPRFPAVGIAGISEIHEAYVNKLVQEKAKDCSWRTKLNFLTALSWAYSSGIQPIPDAPQIAADRTGAWTESLELAMRMRNLEMLVNRPPVEEIDIDSVQRLASESPDIPINERPVKAFMSAFRNLGGGKYKDSERRDEFPFTLKLTELAPYVQDPVTESSVSGFLIPDHFSYPGEGSSSPRRKYYLDLQAMPVNLATFFSTFVTSTADYKSSGVESSAECLVSKTALPVPGYIIGFSKNPEVLTYYAVKGEANFTGLFFPIGSGSDDRSVKLTAYAAAKPFGGRIGPRLFGFGDGGGTLVARPDESSKSRNYISGIDVGNQGFKPGMPIPSSSQFWVNTMNTTLGGTPLANDNITYGIPNMIYDFDSDGDIESQWSAGQAPIQEIEAKPYAGASVPEKYGLYNTYQIKKLKQQLGGNYEGRDITAAELTAALVRSRQVTRYDAVNYLIPDFDSAESGTLPNAVPIAEKMAQPRLEGNDQKAFYYKLYAPLSGPGLLYTTEAQVSAVVTSYMASNKKAVDQFLGALYNVAYGIATLSQSSSSGTDLIDAARSIHINVNPANANGGGSIELLKENSEPYNPDGPGCNQDLASKFNHFFNAEYVACGIIPLPMMMTQYVNSKTNNTDSFYYTTTHLNRLKDTVGRDSIMTAYFPGRRQGVEDNLDALALNPIGAQPVNSSSYSTRRNYYSTKFISLSKVTKGTDLGYRGGALRESEDKTFPDDLGSIDVTNLLNPQDNDISNRFYRNF